MRRSVEKPTRWIAALLFGLSLAILSIPLTAQPADSTAPHPGFGHGYDKAHEVTLNGTIAEVVSKAPTGSPFGLHLMVAGPQGTVDAHLGPFMTKDILEALHTGTPVQIVGAYEKLHGKQILLARQVIFGGRQVTVRNENGMLKMGQGTHARRTTRTAPNGGAQ